MSFYQRFSLTLSLLILQKVYSILENKLEEDNKPPPNNFNFQKPNQPKDIPKRGLVKKKAENKKVVITGKNFEGQNFDVEKETNRVIEKIKSFDRRQLKLDIVSERERDKGYDVLRAKLKLCNIYIV